MERFALANALFSYAPYGLMLRRNDAAFRLVVNRALADLYRSARIAGVYDRVVRCVRAAESGAAGDVPAEQPTSERKEAAMMPGSLSCRWLGPLALSVVFVTSARVVAPGPVSR